MLSSRSGVGGWRRRGSAGGLGPTDTAHGASKPQKPTFVLPSNLPPGGTGPCVPRSTRSPGTFIYFYYILFPRALAAGTCWEDRGWVDERVRSSRPRQPLSAGVSGPREARARAREAGARRRRDANPGPARELRVRRAAPLVNSTSELLFSSRNQIPLLGSVPPPHDFFFCCCCRRWCFSAKR